MRRLAPVLALLTGVALLLAGNGLQGILLPVRAGIEGFSTLSTGLLATFYFTGFLLGCLFGAGIIRAAGHIRTFTAMTAVATAVVLASGFWAVPAFWWPLRMLTGFCFAVLYTVIESWLNEAAGDENRSFVLSVYMIINLSVICVGQMMLPLNPPEQFGSFALVALLISLAAVPVALTRSASPAPVTSTRPRIRRLFSVSPAGVAACLAVGLSTGGFWALTPGYAERRGFDTSGVALLISATVLGGALGQWPLGRLSDRIDRRWVIVLAAAVAGLASGALALLPDPGPKTIYGLCILWGMSILPIYAVGLAHVNDHGRAGDFVETSAGLLLVHAGGAAISPLMASALAPLLGEAAVFAWAAITMGALCLFVAWRKTRTGAPAGAEQIRFVEALQAARTVSPVFDEEIQAELQQQAGEPDDAPEQR